MSLCNIKCVERIARYLNVPEKLLFDKNELNTVLKNLTYIGGTKKTIADIVLYYVLHSIMAELSHQQKARYIHVSRWFDNIQQEEKLRQELDLISFNLLHVFL
ncbi:eukaryotic translation elongation factor 1 epsilon-1 [Monomorium pharaonis]|uniref:eukaryotic translation elongation factor 1 epsilon-1 n=1 Tax=Monomorium pharaonis TaxID=307658 RepID=UPI001745C9FF|nr:eukaryotic translation elongation factor 1 epsilon-1 [Monomorium pharaonis]